MVEFFPVTSVREEKTTHHVLATTLWLDPSLSAVGCTPPFTNSIVWVAVYFKLKNKTGRWQADSLNTVTWFRICKQNLMLLALNTTSNSTGLTEIVGYTSHNTTLSQPSRTTSQTRSLCTSVLNTWRKDADYCRCQKRKFISFTYENESGPWASMQN